MRRTLIRENAQNAAPLPPNYHLKGLSHEIVLKTFDKKITELGLTEGRGWFLNFLEAPIFVNIIEIHLMRQSL